jgi:hypothetical protein
MELKKGDVRVQGGEENSGWIRGDERNRVADILLSATAHAPLMCVGQSIPQYTGRVACRAVPSLSDATPSWRLDIGRRPSPPASGQRELTKTHCTGVIGSPVRSVQTSLLKDRTYGKVGAVLIACSALPAEKWINQTTLQHSCLSEVDKPDRFATQFPIWSG